MKQALLYLFLLTFTLVFSKTPPTKKVINPAIGVQMTGYYMNPNMVQYTVKIKNIGEETLTNIYATDPLQTPFFTFFTPIASMAPGEEIINLYVYKTAVSPCFDSSQILVHATTLLGDEITDLSSDIYGFDNNGLSGSYYNDIVNQTQGFIQSLNTAQDGIYEDTNNNAIIDVGDVINYTYSIYDFSGIPFISCEIFDDNAVVTNPNFTFINNYSTIGIHYLTQADIDLGYVYNSSYVLAPESCQGIYGFQDQSYCNSCPNPVGANIITKLTSLLPNKISGSVKFNANNDCTTAFNFPNRRVATSYGPNEYVTYTNYLGNYALLIPNTGSYTTTATSNLSANFSSTPDSIVTNSSGENIDYNTTQFCISSSTNYSDLRVNLFNVNQAIPGFAATYRLYYQNLGSTNLNGTIVLNYDSSKLSSLNATPTEDVATVNTLTWNYTNLLPFETRYIELSSLVLPPPAVASGDINTLTLTGNPIATDSNPANNTFVLNQTVFSSFDPNDKSVLEGPTITASQATGYLNYVTRFQNTGTANATTVVVKEMLDPDLDWSTFEPIDASHPYTIQIRNGNDLTYTFSNIALPHESANEPASHGWLAYRIKPKSTFALGDIVNSNSNIYFDFNPPILTNTVHTQLVVLATSDFIKSNFVVYPNPAHDFINIENKNNLDASYEITDGNGKLLQKSAVENSRTIDISKFQDGFYFLTLKAKYGKSTYKFIKK